MRVQASGLSSLEGEYKSENGLCLRMRNLLQSQTLVLRTSARLHGKQSGTACAFCGAGTK